MARNRDSGISAQQAMWYLDRRVPIALVLAIFAQSAAFVWWASGVSHDIQKLKEEVATLKGEAKDRLTMILEIATVKSDLRHMASAVERLERAVDKLGPARMWNSAPRARATTP